MNTNTRFRDLLRSDFTKERAIERLAVKASLGHRSVVEAIAAAYAPVIALEVELKVQSCAMEKDLERKLENAILKAIPLRRLPRRRAVPWLFRVIRATAREVRWEHARDARIAAIHS